MCQPSVLYKLPFLLLLLVAWKLQAQNPAFDTLLAKEYYRQALYHDYTTLNQDSAIYYYQKAGKIYLAVQNWKMYLSSQSNIAHQYFFKGDYEKTLELALENLSLCEEKYDPYDQDLGKAYNLVGVIYKNLGEYEQARTYYTKAAQVAKAAQGDDRILKPGYDINIAATYELQGYYHQAIPLLEQTLEELHALGHAHHTYATVALTSLGNCYNYLEDYDYALAWHLRALEVEKETYGDNHPKLGIPYTNIGITYYHKKDYAQALYYFDKALNVEFGGAHTDHPEAISIFINIGDVYHDKGELDKALQYFQKALAMARDKRKEDHPEIAIILGAIGETHYKKGETELAIHYHEQALGINLDKLGTQNPRTAYNYVNMARAYQNKRDYAQALTYFQDALIGLTHTFENKDYHSNPVLEDIILNPVVATILKNKAHALKERFDRENHQLEDLKTALDTYLLAVDILDAIMVNYHTNESKQHLLANYLPVYEGGIAVAKQLYDLTEEKQYIRHAFRISEGSKARVLQASLKDFQAKHFVGIPDSLIERENQLKIDLSVYEERFYEAKQANDTAKIQYNQTHLFQQKLAYDSLIQQLEKQYPAYYHLKYDLSVASVEDIQKDILKPQTALLHYFVGDSTLYVFSITSYDSHFYAIEKPQHFEQLIQSFRNNISDTDLLLKSQREAFTNYIHQADTLYRLILEKPLSEFPVDIDQLIVVPDGQLGYLPMEALALTPSSEASHFGDIDYMLYHYQISYAYSATLLAASMKNSAPSSSDLFAGFAPEYTADFLAMNDTLGESMLNRFARDGNLPLPGAIREVEQISNFFEGETWLGKQATERNFKAHAGEYQILHLAMHGLIDDHNPLYSKLIFNAETDSVEDGLLNAAEIYNMKLNAALTVLSACNTAYGIISRGEGIMSLSRAFAYAGCPSMVASLWKAADQSTAEIMVNFYQNLKEGLPKDAALQQAKLKYLQTYKNSPLLHPYYWATFVPIGNMESLENSDTYTHYIIGGMIGLLCIGLMIHFQYFSNKK